MKKSKRQMQFLYHFAVGMYVWMNVSDVGVNGEPSLMSRMKKVKDNIFKDYDKYIRPMEETNTTKVRTYFHPRQIIEIEWIDPRLKWNRTDYDGALQVPISMLWVPDVSVFNSHSLQVKPALEVLLEFHPNGQVWWVPPVRTQTTCSTAIRLLPHSPDKEMECEIIIGSWMTQGWQVDFQHGQEMYMDFFRNIHPGWELIEEKAFTYRNETYYESNPEPYISVQVVLPMRRRPVPAIVATRTPCILIVILTLSIFWLPPDSNKKLVLGGFLFVVLSIVLVYVGWSTRSHLKVMFKVPFLQSSMYIIALTILLQVFVVIKMASQSGPVRPPSAITHILTGPVGKYACLISPLKEDDSLDRIQSQKDSSTVEAFTARAEWKLLAAATDRALFVIMALVMISVHHL